MGKIKEKKVITKQQIVQSESLKNNSIVASKDIGNASSTVLAGKQNERPA